jgi:uncharacterized membrane protein
MKCQRPPGQATWPRLSLLLRRPVATLVLLSTLFGIPTVFFNPPLRGADEPAHFLRAYGIAQGQIVPSLVDAQGRRGIFLPASLDDDYEFFEAARYKFSQEAFNYRDILAEYLQRRRAGEAPERQPVFVLYAGSEGYTPVAYLPYAAAAIVARVAGLDFVPMLWLMRLAGLAATTAMAAYAIAMVPYLRSSFLFIALLPIALYERAIVSADGMTLSSTMLVTALCLKYVDRSGERRWERSLWTTLCVLTKPSQMAFVALEAMTHPCKDLLRRWRTICLIVAPGLVLLPLWIAAVSADVAAWRIIEGTGAAAEHFSPLWKLGFLFDHPHHFLQAALGSLRNAEDHWREAIEVLGWRDTPLPAPLFRLLSAMFLATCLVPLRLDPPTRARIAVVTGLTMLAYCLAIFLIFYLVWTPLDAGFVHGVQGRYFTMLLPPAALFIAALVNRGPREPVTAIIAVTGALISGVATVDAVVRSQW